jgi:hypothetical protein
MLASRRLTGVSAGSTVAHYDVQRARPEVSGRQAHAEATYERLFGPRDKGAPDNGPELMEILRRFTFGDVFDTGALDDQTREFDHRDGAGLPADPAPVEVAHGGGP